MFMAFISLLLLSGCNSQPTTLPPLTTLQQGEKLFANQCAGCHANGGNGLNPAKPVKGSAKFKDKAAFIAYLRQPGAGMPAYDASAIADSDAEVLRHYLVTQFGQ
jgi:mono/diheme cytochrome c family protein